MDTKIEIKSRDNESYGYLWRVIKESLLAAGKPFFTSDVPHPDVLSEGWELNYKWPHVNRRIWFRLVQNGWKHRGLVFRHTIAFANKEFQTFPRPCVVTKVLHVIKNPSFRFNGIYGEHESDYGWTEILPANIKELSSCAYQDGQFHLYGTRLLVNVKDGYKCYYVVMVEQ